MTNAELIAEARKLLEDYPNYQQYPGGPLLKYPHQDALMRVANALEAAEARVKELEAQAKDHKAEQIFRISELQELGEAQARIAELEAGGWEYGVKWHDLQDPVWYHPYTVDEAEMKLAYWPKEPGYVVRRRKADEWLPVESEGA